MAAAWTGWNKWHISEFLCKRVSTHRHEGEFSSNKAPWHLGSSSWLAVTSTTTSAYILNAARKPAKLNSLPYSYSFSLLFTSVCPFSDWTDCNDKTLKEKKETTDFFSHNSAVTRWSTCMIIVECSKLLSTALALRFCQDKSPAL